MHRDFLCLLVFFVAPKSQAVVCEDRVLHFDRVSVGALEFLMATRSTKDMKSHGAEPWEGPRVEFAVGSQYVRAYRVKVQT